MRTLIHLLIMALTLTASTSTNARALEATSHLAAAPPAQKLASGPSGSAAAVDARTSGLQLLELHHEIGSGGSWTASGFVVLVHNTCLPNVARWSAGPSGASRTVLYHYTDAAGFRGIVGSGVMRASGGDALYGAGQYFTDITASTIVRAGSPAGPGMMGQRLVERILFGSRARAGDRLSHYLAIDVRGLRVMRVAEDLGRPVRSHIFMRPGADDLNVAERIIWGGPTF